MATRFCDMLTNELTVARMARALRGVDLADPRARLAAYEAIPAASEHIRDFDADAVATETRRRGIAPAPKKRTA